MEPRILVNENSCLQHRNYDAKPWVVQKFGGTSVGKFADKIAEDLVRPSLADHRIAVICSARSSSTKLEGTTNRLIRAAREAGISNPHNYRNIVNCIRDDHIQAAKSFIHSPEIVLQLLDTVAKECQDLIAFLAATQKVGEISPKSTDKIISKGETLSARFVAAVLRDRNVDSQFVELSEIIDIESNHCLDQDFYGYVAAKLGEQIEKYGEKVPVLTGFFGRVPKGLLNQIGRGYTDLCAALVAVGLGAKELQVIKEVDGVFTADPRKVPTARLIGTITAPEAAELTFYGSEVIHPFTMQQVIQARIPIRIKNVANPRGSGTLISAEVSGESDSSVSSHKPKLFRARNAGGLLQSERPKRPTALTIKHKILVINVHSNKRTLSHGFFAKIFSTLDKWRLCIDLISTSEVHVSMALHSESALVTGTDDEREIADSDLRGAIEELRGYGKVDIMDDMAILSLVGKQMKNMVGIAGKMFSTLGENNVNIEMISQGASEINISTETQTAGRTTLDTFDVKVVSERQKQVAPLITPLLRVAVGLDSVEANAFDEEPTLDLGDGPSPEEKLLSRKWSQALVATVSLCMLCYARNQQSNLLQVVLGYLAYADNVTKRVYEIPHRMWLTVTIRNGPERSSGKRKGSISRGEGKG